LSVLRGIANARPVQIQPLRRRAAQAAAILVITAGALVLVVSLAILGPVVVGPPQDGEQS